MDTTLFKSKSKNKTKIVEVIRHNILEILNENKNTSSISVMEVANKFRTEGQFYLVFKEDKSFIVNVKNNYGIKRKLNFYKAAPQTLVCGKAKGFAKRKKFRLAPP